MMNYKNEYVISCMSRLGEQDINFYSNEFYKVGSCIKLDGLDWYVNEVVSRNPENDAEALMVVIVDECGYSIEKAESFINQMIADNVELVTENLWSYLVRD